MRRALRRLGWSLFVVWAVVTLAFAVNNLVPGDPARMVAGVQARPADVDRIRVQLGLDRPPLVQYALFWKRLSHADLGRSYQLGQPVVDLIAAKLPNTFALALAGIVLQLLFGLTTGVLAAWRRGGWLDRALVGTSLLGVSAPTFLIALMLQYVLAYRLRWLPLDGYGKTPLEQARCLVLPALTLGIYGAAYYTRLVRDEMAVMLAQDWIRTARAKGLGPARILVRHALRNGLVPVVTSVGLDFGALMGGAIVTEQVFRWPGIGKLAVDGMHDRDGPVILACVVVSAMFIVVSNLLADAVHARLDPRMRASG